MCVNTWYTFVFSLDLFVYNPHTHPEWKSISRKLVNRNEQILTIVKQNWFRNYRHSKRGSVDTGFDVENYLQFSPFFIVHNILLVWRIPNIFAINRLYLYQYPNNDIPFCSCVFIKGENLGRVYKINAIKVYVCKGHKGCRSHVMARCHNNLFERTECEV